MKNTITLILMLSTSLVFGNGIEVSNVSFNQPTNKISFTLTWENSWNYSNLDPDLRDGAHVFIKYAPNGGDTWFHAEILDSTYVADHTQYISYDDLSAMIFYSPGVPWAGTFAQQQFTLELAPMAGGYQDFKVFATEMVFIDDKDFYAGDTSSPGRFHQGNSTITPLLIESEDGIMRGNGADQFGQEGVMSSTSLSAAFPKGWTMLWCMKYKISAQQYVDFLNCLTRTQQNARVQADLSGTVASNKYVMTNTPNVQDRNPIACNVNIGTGAINFFVDLDDTNAPNSSNDGGNIALNHINPIDIIAYMDWSGLRPMSELEYEKITRGDALVTGGEYAWGTDTYISAGTISNPGMANETTNNVGNSPLFLLEPLRVGYAATMTSDRVGSCATFWGVMDIHNLGEFMYGVESLNFAQYSYGDGNLNSFGNAVVSAWTVSAQLLCSQDLSAPAIEPISQGKNSILNPTIRYANMGARGMRKYYQE